MKKIDDAVLIEMSDSGTPQKDIAAHFGVSPQAICKRKRQLEQQAATAAVLEPLTEQQKRFVAEICSGTGQSASALAAYDCLPDSSKAIGNRLMKDERITTAINVIMESEGLTRSHLIKRLKHHIDGGCASTSMRGIEVGLKLFGELITSKNLNINADVSPVADLLSAYG
jgi:hypothetical protein